jgi:hypothetical protein
VKKRKNFTQRACSFLPEVEEKKKGQILSDAVVQTVIHFYKNDEYSHLCPSKKDFVSVEQQPEESTHREHGYKGLVLCNLQELYVAFFEKHLDVSDGFSKFHYCIKNTAALHMQEGPMQYVWV